MPKVRVNSFAISLDGYGAGESLLQGIDLPKLGYEVSEHVPSEGATLVVFHDEIA
jgi:hypothetical protein